MNSRTVLKSGIWYTISNFLLRGVAFITTPIFSRILSQTEYGYFSNYASWVSLLTICVTFDLEATLIIARHDHEDNIDEYVLSMFALSSIGVIGFGVLCNIFKEFAENLFSMNISYINSMIAYMLFIPVINIFTALERFRYKYKTTVLIGFLTTFVSSVLAVILILNMDDKLAARTIGFVIPTIITGFIVYVIYVVKVHHIKIAFWKYALPIALPFIPHLLSMNLLNSIDRIMITKICGPEQNALYSIAYSVGAMVTILVSAINNAYSPWLGDKLRIEEYDTVRKYTKYYVLGFSWVALGIILLSPEVLYILGGKQYMQAIHCMPPIAMGCICQFIYCMYVNVEQYYKKTVGMAAASVSAAGLNYILNYLFIPKFGYVAAAYTTLASYLWLMVFHMYLVKRINKSYVYNNKLISCVIAFLLIITTLINALYNYNIARYIVVVLFVIISVCILIKYKERFLRFWRKG